MAGNFLGQRAMTGGLAAGSIKLGRKVGQRKAACLKYRDSWVRMVLIYGSSGGVLNGSIFAVCNFSRL